MLFVLKMVGVLHEIKEQNRLDEVIENAFKLNID